MPRKLSFAVVAALLAVTIPGCSSPNADPPPAGSVAPPGSPAEPGGRSAPPSSRAADVLPLEFRRTGGFIGADDRVSISADGVVTVSRKDVTGTPFTLDAARLAELRRLLTEPAPVEPASRPTKPAVCNDGYVYQIRTSSWSVATDDCSRQRRPALDPVLQLLVSLLR